MLSSSHRSLTFLLSNCLLLSETIEWAILNWHMIFFHKNLDVFASVILASSLTLTHICKVVYSHNCKVCTSFIFWQGTYEVHALLGEGLGVGYCSQFLWRLSLDGACILNTQDLTQFKHFKRWEQVHHLFQVRSHTFVPGYEVTIDLAYNQLGVAIDK